MRGGAPLLEKEWLDRFSDLLTPSAAVLDIGCGTGRPLAQQLIARGFAVTGLDCAPAMIALCRLRLPQAEWVAGDMRRMALGRKFGGLLAWHSFFHLPATHQRAMFGRFRAHALPGAALKFTTGPDAGVRIGEFEGEPLYHASLDEQEYRALLKEHAFALIRQRTADPACGGATVWLARVKG